MALLTFPTLSGLSYPVKRSPRFATIEHTSITGVASTQSPQPYAIYDYDLPFEFLRSDNATLELQQLMSFYTALRGKANPFLFDDPDDDTVTDQQIGQGDGVTTDFGFVRTRSNDIEPVQAADAGGLVVKVNGVTKTLTTQYTILTTAQWATNYGVRFTAGNVPTPGQPVTATFTYKWLCRFSDDAQEFSKFMLLNGKGLWEAKSVRFHSQPQ